MNQQQNQQQSNELQKKAEEALAASFAMPPIRTMADDLLEASKGVTVPVMSATPVNSVKPVQQSSSSPARPNTLQTPNPTPKSPAGNTVAMPSAPKQENTKSFVTSMLAGVGLALVISMIAFGGYLFWPKNTNTVADGIPAETIAFVSIKRGAGALEQVVLPKIISNMGLASSAFDSEWIDLVFGIIPGSTASEPVGYLIINESSSIDTSSNPGLVLKKLANGYNLIVDSKETGRLDGLSGKSLGSNTEFRELAKQLSAGSEYIYLGQDGVSLLSRFSLLKSDEVAPLLLAVSPSEQGARMLPLAVARGNNKKFVKSQLSWAETVKAVPAAAIAVAGHGDIAGDAEKWRLDQANKPQLQAFLNTLTAQGEAADALKANLAGHYIAGSLATGSTVPDGVAVLPLKNGTTALVQAQMTTLEEAFKYLGPLIGGAEFAGVSFEDGNYRDVAIRFVNFGDPNHSFDYAIIDSLLLVSTSKQSMQQMIDAYKGEIQNFASIHAASGTGQVGWQYLLLDGGTVVQLPAAWKTLLSGITSTYFEPVSEGVYTGNIAY